MATRKKAAPADGTLTAGDLAKSWPFPTTTQTEDVTDVTPKGELAAGDALVPAGERIHVAEVQLYTDPAQNTVAIIAIEQLVESPFNPRTRFDGLQEMAETMKAVGVMQPILVRPVTLPGGFDIRKGDEPQQAYEIVYGHRRYRSAKLAGLATMPAIVRELTDAQAAQLQAIENVQRKDLDPVEEARGYKHYIEVHGVTKDQLAAEIGLSRSHVYSRLKLIQAVTAVLEALQAGEIFEENALHIARIPSTKLQEKALASIRSNHLDLEDGGKRSVRRIRDFLRERFTLQLKDAIFPTADAQLLPLAGACTTCSKRSGNAPEFHDLANDTEKDWSGKLRAGPDLCTDPDCWDAKKKAHLANKAAELQAKGKTVITGGKARASVDAGGQVKGAYIELKNVKAELAKKGKKAGTDVAVVTIQNPRDGKTKEAVAIADLQAIGLMKSKTKDASSGRGKEQRDYEAEEREREERAARETKVNYAILNAVRSAAAGQPLTTLALQLVVQTTVQGLEWEDKEPLAKLHGFKTEHELEKKIGQLTADRLATLLLDCALIRNVESDGYDRGEHGKPQALLTAAKHYGVDVKAIAREIEKVAPDTKTQDLLPQQDEEEEAEEA